MWPRSAACDDTRFCVADGDAVLIESSPIVEYLDQRFPSEGQRLLPDDPLQRFRVRKVTAVCCCQAGWVVHAAISSGSSQHPVIFRKHVSTEVCPLAIPSASLSRLPQGAVLTRTDHTDNLHSAPQVKLFTEAFTDKVPIYSILRATTKAELEVAKQNLVDGLKARVQCGCTAAHSAVHRLPESAVPTL